MAQGLASSTTPDDPLRKLDDKAIAPAPARHYRAAAFQIFVLFGSLLFVVLAVVAHTVAYFPLDLTVTRAVQSYHGAAFDQLMYAVSWVGFMPQVYLFGAAIVLLLFFGGLRWEATATLVAAAGVGIGTLVKLIVYRPRPSADLVHVLSQLPSSGFPSGHVLVATTFCGFLAFLGYTLLKQSAIRTLVLIAFAVLITLMGLSRIYEGQHWFSDVMGAYLLGSLWLSLSIRVYRWGKPRFFAHQPMAPETPAARTT